MPAEDQTPASLSRHLSQSYAFRGGSNERETDEEIGSGRPRTFHLAGSPTEEVHSHLDSAFAFFKVE